MKVAIQINSYKGDGTPLETEYIFGYLELKEIPKTSTIIFERPNTQQSQVTVKFNLSEFSVDEIGIRVKGTNIDGYGKVDVYAATENSCVWDLAGVSKQKTRLMKIYDELPKFYKDNYGNIEDIDKLSREQYDLERISQYKEKIRELEKK